jgi:hypothetical protein
VADAFQAGFMIVCISNPTNHFWQAEFFLAGGNALAGRRENGILSEPESAWKRVLLKFC